MNYEELLQNRAELGTRLNKYLADAGLCSRRGADEIIAAGRVTLNGAVAEPGARVHPGDKVCVDGTPLLAKTAELPVAPAGRQAPPTPDEDGRQRVTIALNKPVGIICTTDRREKKNIIDFMKFPLRIFPIGRLDKDSSGLLLLTNEGDLVNRVLRAENHHEKEYIVEVDRLLTEEFLDEMSRGVPILDTVTLPCEIRRTGPREFRICLTQGLNRQIRRMCEYFGYEVKSLKRVRIMHITLGNLKPGEWRYLTASELAQLEELLDRK